MNCTRIFWTNKGYFFSLIFCFCLHIPPLTSIRNLKAVMFLKTHHQQKCCMMGNNTFKISGEMVETNVCIEVWTPSKICKNLDLPIFPIFKRIVSISYPFLHQFWHMTHLWSILNFLMYFRRVMFIATRIFFIYRQNLYSTCGVVISSLILIGTEWWHKIKNRWFEKDFYMVEHRWLIDA